MSSTKRNAARSTSLDFYATPPHVARAICQRLLVNYPTSIRRDGYFLEPSCGTGNFMLAMRETWPLEAQILGVEIDPKWADVARSRGLSVIQQDFRSYTKEHKEVGSDPFDLIAGNPPFNTALQFISDALPLLRPKGVLAFILRLGFLASEERAAFWAEMKQRKLLSQIIVLSNRPSWTGKGNDSADYMVACFQAGSTNPTINWLATRPSKERLPL